MRGRTEQLPAPRAHLAATLRLVDALVERAGGFDVWPGASAVREVLARPFRLPASVRPEQNGLKYDAYVTEGPDGPAWGVAFNDRWEGRAVWATVEELATRLPDGVYDLDRVRAARAAIASSSVNVSLGFDAPGQPPRLKLYLQEADWAEGVLRADAFASLPEAVRGGCVLPEEVPADAPLGVITVVLRPDGSSGLKVYLGGPTPSDAASGLGARWPEVDALADGMAAACPSRPAFHYLTLRLEEGREPRFAMNRIWDHVRVGFGTGEALDAAWAEVGALFARAGRDEAFAELASMRGALQDLRLVPTAAAYERGGSSADVYLAAWPA